MSFPILLRSFRLRMALLSGVVSGLVLAVFTGLTFAAMHRIMLQRMDESIKELGHRHLVEPVLTQDWQRVCDALRFFRGEEEENTFFLLAKSRGGSVEFATSNWPGDLPKNEFPAADAWGEYLEQDDSSPLEARAREDRSPPSMPRRPGLRGAGASLPRRFPPPPVRGDPREAPGSWGVLAGGSVLPPVPLKKPVFSSRSAGGTEWRIGMMGNPETTLVIGLNMEQFSTEMAHVRNALLMALPVALAVVAAGAWWISQRALKPIQAVTAAIQRVMAKGLDQRLAGEDEDVEFSALIAAFNEMMDWLERSFRQAVRFSADASHELKTPLTVLQANLEQAVQEARPGSDEQRRYAVLAKELQRLKGIVRKLLLLSRMDAGELKLNLRPLDLSTLVEGVVEDTQILAPHLTVRNELAPGLWVRGDSDLMKQVVQNLATNAVKYNEPAGFIEVKLQQEGPAIRLAISNAGPGIPPEERGRVFTRFFRGDRARGRVGGAGLGLSLSREIVRAHEGELVLEHSSKESTVFVLVLPAASPAQ